MSFAACGKKNSNDSNTNSSQQATVSINQDNTKEETESSEQDSRDSQTEYVETYFVYAEQGAVVTWFDSKTGEFSYKAKCETCGKTESGTHSGLRGGHNTTYSSSYSCQNAQCSEWGKLQPVKIGCEVTGEWIEVSD